MSEKSTHEEMVRQLRDTEQRLADLQAERHRLEEALRLCRPQGHTGLQAPGEEGLRQSEKHYRLALDATSDGVWDRNLQTGEVYYGENWARLLGYTAREVKSLNLRWEDLLHSDDKAGALAAVREHIEGGTSRYVAEFRMRNKSGGWRWILARGKVVEWDVHGRPLRFVGTHSDISDRKQAEEELEKSSRKIRQFAYSVVHDLKNPAHSIQALAGVLQRKYGQNLPPRGVQCCEQIARSAEQLAAIVDKINCYIATQQNPLTLETVSLRQAFATIREEFADQCEARRVRWREPEQLPEIMIDRISLLRVLRNFVDNALKYGGTRLSEIELGYREGEGFHILSVRDDGVGISVEESDNVFDAFIRKKTAAGVAGSGLGLAIVKEIAGQHRGEVWVECGLPRGAAFYASFAKSLGAEATPPPGAPAP